MNSTKAARSNASSKKPQLTWVNSSLVIAAIGLVVLETVLTNSQVAFGSHSNQLYQQRTELSNQVSDLKWKIAQYKSLSYIQEYAQIKLKMEPLATNILYREAPNEE